ncbi:GNAT family N-acetyltransferase [Streptomyces harbinensis]
MDASRYRIRPLQATDIDAALELMGQANPDYDPQSLAGTRPLLEMTAAPTGSRTTSKGLREMSRELAKLADGALTEEEIHRRLRDRVATGEGLPTVALHSLVAEEIATGEVVGLVNAGPPGKWVHHVFAKLPAPMVRQMRERVVEILEIAVSPRARRRGIGRALMEGLLNLDSEAARNWRVAIWFFHADNGFGAFHRTVAPQWPAGHPIAFGDSRRVGAGLRELTGDLRACVAPLHPGIELVKDTSTGVPVIMGVFDHSWPETPPTRRPAPPSKSERKRAKKARGRARG